MPKKNPADAGRGQGSEIVVCFPARDCSRDNPTATPSQSLAAHHLARRFGLDATRARLTAELAWGRP